MSLLRFGVAGYRVTGERTVPPLIAAWGDEDVLALKKGPEATKAITGRDFGKPAKGWQACGGRKPNQAQGGGRVAGEGM